MTDNKKSLNDFEKIFLGKGGNTGPLIVPYNFDELVEDLNAVVPYDWATFLHDRIDKINPRADLAGIEQGGYKLVYKDKPSATERMMSQVRAAALAGPRLLVFRSACAWATTAASPMCAGMVPPTRRSWLPAKRSSPSTGKSFQPTALRAAIRAAKGNTEPIHLIVQADSFVSMVDIDYHDGERYPVLERVDGTPDYLDDITKPLTTPEKAPAGAQEKDE